MDIWIGEGSTATGNGNMQEGACEEATEVIEPLVV
jgi:hypothetical protein